MPGPELPATQRMVEDLKTRVGSVEKILEELKTRLGVVEEELKKMKAPPLTPAPESSKRGRWTGL